MPLGHTSITEEETESEEAVPDLPAPNPILSCNWVYVTTRMVSKHPLIMSLHA